MEQLVFMNILAHVATLICGVVFLVTAFHMRAAIHATGSHDTVTQDSNDITHKPIDDNFLIQMGFKKRSEPEDECPIYFMEFEIDDGQDGTLTVTLDGIVQLHEDYNIVELPMIYNTQGRMALLVMALGLMLEENKPC